MPSSANHNRTEILTGIIVFIGVLYVIYVAVGLAGWTVGKHGYILYADFFSASGLHVGDPVLIAGVEVGDVESISLADYQARVVLRFKDGVTIQEDAIAAIENKGLLGDRSVSVEPGNFPQITWARRRDQGDRCADKFPRPCGQVGCRRLPIR